MDTLLSQTIAASGDKGNREQNRNRSLNRLKPKKNALLIWNGEYVSPTSTGARIQREKEKAGKSNRRTEILPKPHALTVQRIDR